MEIDLGFELEEFIRAKIASGEYSGAAEVLRAAVILRKEEENADDAELAELRRDLASGIAQLDNGEGKTWDPEEANIEGRKLRDARRRKVS